MATYVLVHGAWGGAHGWRKVRPLLHRAEHEVFTPSLTGIGERAHLTGPHVTLSVHIDDVVNTILYEDLKDIVLLGFSYGGMVVTGALEHIADRVAELVYLDAFVPTDGDSINSLRDSAPPRRSVEDDWLIPPIPRDLDDPAETAWSNARRSHQPGRTFDQPVRLLEPVESYPFGRTYIKALNDPTDAPEQSPFWPVAERVRDNPAWRYHEIDTNHMIPQNRPEELVAILTELAP
ncbi:MAG: alpha/beta hydrolase [Actinomycetia bacterium]|nr:alpha/beta hydrolase [Actinomycetes bacterium]